MKYIKYFENIDPFEEEELESDDPTDDYEYCGYCGTIMKTGSYRTLSKEEFEKFKKFNLNYSDLEPDVCNDCHSEIDKQRELGLRDY